MEFENQQEIKIGSLRLTSFVFFFVTRSIVATLVFDTVDHLTASYILNFMAINGLYKPFRHRPISYLFTSSS